MEDRVAAVELYEHLSYPAFVLFFLLGVVFGSTLPFISDYIRMKFYKGGMGCRQCPWPFTSPRPPKDFMDQS